MELKDYILSTLQELTESIEEEMLENDINKNKSSKNDVNKKGTIIDIPKKEIENIPIPQTPPPAPQKVIDIKREASYEDDEDVGVSNPNLEREFLTNLRERILVLFEGLQNPKNSQIDVKVDIILNFLEYLLSMIEERVEILSKINH